MTDIVNHPPHYKTRGGIECITATRGMGFDLGNAVKYVYRAWDKKNLVIDLQKAQWYLHDHMSFAEAQAHTMSTNSRDALRRIANTAPSNSDPRRFFHAIADGDYRAADVALNAMVNAALRSS